MGELEARSEHNIAIIIINSITFLSYYGKFISKQVLIYTST